MLYEQGGLNHDMTFALTAAAFYSLERPEAKVSPSMVPRLYGACIGDGGFYGGRLDGLFVCFWFAFKEHNVASSTSHSQRNTSVISCLGLLASSQCSWDNVRPNCR